MTFLTFMISSDRGTFLTITMTARTVIYRPFISQCYCKFQYPRNKVAYSYVQFVEIFCARGSCRS